MILHHCNDITSSNKLCRLYYGRNRQDEIVGKKPCGRPSDTKGKNEVMDMFRCEHKKMIEFMKNCPSPYLFI